MRRRRRSLFLILPSALMLGCGGGPVHFNDRSTVVRYDTVLVANQGDSTISVFQSPRPGQAFIAPAVPVNGSPFPVNGPPTALAKGPKLIVASETAKSVALFAIDLRNGVLGSPIFTIKTTLTPKAAAGTYDFFYVANAEGNVSGYGLTANGLSAWEVGGSPFPAGAGPAAITIVGNNFVYVANSLSNNISGFALDHANGALTPLPGSPYPAGQGPVAIEQGNPQGGFNVLTGYGFLFVANAASNDVAVYSIAADGSLTAVSGSPFAAGEAPSALAANTFGGPINVVYVANSKANNVSGFSVDPTSGSLTPLPGSPYAVGPNPAAMAFGQQALYVANSGSNTLSVLLADADGALGTDSGSPLTVGNQPSAVVFLKAPQ